MVFFSCLFFLYLNLAFVLVIFGKRGISTRWAAVNEEGLIPYKTAVGTADGGEKPPALGAVLRVPGYFGATVIAEKAGDHGDGGVFLSFGHFFGRLN